MVRLVPGADEKLLEKKRAELIARKKSFRASAKNVSFCAPEMVPRRYPELVHLRVGIRLIELLASGKTVNTWDLSRSRVDFSGEGFESGVLEIVKNHPWPYAQ